MSNLILARVDQVVNISYNTIRVTYKLYLENLNQEDVYCAVFAKEQKSHLNKVLKSKKLNIIYQAPAALNKMPGHSRSKNVLVIFELKREE